MLWYCIESGKHCALQLLMLQVMHVCMPNLKDTLSVTASTGMSTVVFQNTLSLRMPDMEQKSPEVNEEETGLRWADEVSVNSIEDDTEASDKDDIEESDEDDNEGSTEN